MTRQTAVELLKQDLDSEMKSGTKMVVNWDMYLEMEKQQIIDAHLIGLITSLEMEATKQATEYFNETYGSKGSDDKKEPKDIVLGYKTSLESQMLDSQLPQTEILS